MFSIVKSKSPTTAATAAAAEKGAGKKENSERERAVEVEGEKGHLGERKKTCSLPFPSHRFLSPSFKTSTNPPPPPRSSLLPPFHAFQPWLLLRSSQVGLPRRSWGRGRCRDRTRGALPWIVSRRPRGGGDKKKRMPTIKFILFPPLPSLVFDNNTPHSPRDHGDALERAVSARLCVCGTSPRHVRCPRCAQNFLVDDDGGGGETHAFFFFALLEDHHRRHRRAAGSLQVHWRPGETQDRDQRYVAGLLGSGTSAVFYVGEEGAEKKNVSFNAPARERSPRRRSLESRFHRFDLFIFCFSLHSSQPFLLLLSPSLSPFPLPSGFGRIGRLVMRVCLERDDVEVRRFSDGRIGGTKIKSFNC